MTDIERLRRIAETIRQAPPLEPLADAVVEAADEIERLERERKRLGDELFNLRNRCGCGPDQAGPDVWQEIERLRTTVVAGDREIKASHADADRLREENELLRDVIVKLGDGNKK